MSEGIDIAAALAGQVNRELQEVPNRKPINPQEFLQKAGIPMNRPTPMPVRSYPGMIEAPKSTPMGSEILSTTTDMPTLIEMPDDLKKYVEGDPQLDPNVVVPTITAPTPIVSAEQFVLQPVEKTNPYEIMLDMQQRLERIEQLLLKGDKYKKSNKLNSYQRRKLKKLNESNTTPITGSSSPETTTPGDAPQTT